MHLQDFTRSALAYEYLAIIKLMGEGMKLFSSIYIGSYETTMKVFEISKQKGIKTIDTLKISSDIIKDILSVGRIMPETCDKLCRVLNDMKRTSDGGSIHVGDFYSAENVSIDFGNNISINHKGGINSSFDGFIVKFDQFGVAEWAHDVGYYETYESLQVVKETRDGGIVVAGNYRGNKNKL